MLILTESTLFFINMMWSTPGSPNRKENMISKINQWTSRVQKEQQTASRSLVGVPSITTATDVPPSTVVSKATQSTSATSLEDKDCEMGFDEDDAGYGAFGEDGDDALEREEALRATAKGKHVSPCKPIRHSYSHFLSPVARRIDSSATKAGGTAVHTETKGF